MMARGGFYRQNEGGRRDNVGDATRAGGELERVAARRFQTSIASHYLNTS